MQLRFTPLHINLAKLPETYAVYCLRHDPTSKVYFGSTTNLQDRLTQWYYAIKAPRTTAKVPTKVFNLLFAHGRNPQDWSYAIVDTIVPPKLNAKARADERPEWPCVLWALAKCPDLLLNDPHGGKRRRRRDDTSRPWGPRGVSPIRYLGVMLGIQPGQKYPQQPAHDRPVDLRKLPHASAPEVPFAVYLYRSMNYPRPRHMNPSPAAMQALYDEWLRHQPAGYPPKSEARTIASVQDALELPSP